MSTGIEVAVSERHLSYLVNYDLNLLDLPLNKLTGTQALTQLLFLASRHAEDKDPVKSVCLGTSEVLTKRFIELYKVLEKGFDFFNSSGKVLDNQKPGRVIIIGGGHSTADLVALAAIADLKDVPASPSIRPDPVFPGLVLSDAEAHIDLSSGKRFGLGENKTPGKVDGPQGTEFP